ncbi:MAG: hypothetical protein N3F63_04260 [Thermoplasmata archaeon]|nr:hypothetical protein [Thermoplasmata archaeon]
MGNRIFEITVEELSFLGDILSMGVVKKGLVMVGATPDSVTRDQMLQALDLHIIPSIRSFVSPEKASQVKHNILKKLEGGK